MIKTHCNTCNLELWRSPSKIERRNFCSRECYSQLRNKELQMRGLETRITKETYKKLRPKALEELRKKTTGKFNYAWKGDKVSYRGLHQWVRRLKGKPTKCVHCGKESSQPRAIQWANIDGKYRRNIHDFISLCVSCHKIHDLQLISTQGEPSATQ